MCGGGCAVPHQLHHPHTSHTRHTPLVTHLHICTLSQSTARTSEPILYVYHRPLNVPRHIIVYPFSTCRCTYVHAFQVYNVYICTCVHCSIPPMQSLLPHISADVEVLSFGYCAPQRTSDRQVCRPQLSHVPYSMYMYCTYNRWLASPTTLEVQ